MTRKPRRVSLDVQALEGRALLSMMGLAPPKGTVEIAARARAPLTRLSANLKGRFVLGADHVTLTLRQGSTVQRVGAVKGSGTLHFSGGMVEGGTLTFGGRKGQITLQLVGTVPLPTTPQARITLNLVVAGGTGAFANLGGTVLANLGIMAKTPTSGNFTASVKSA